MKKRATTREEGILAEASEEVASSVDGAHMKKRATMREEGVLLEANEESAPGDGRYLHYISIL